MPNAIRYIKLIALHIDDVSVHVCLDLPSILALPTTENGSFELFLIATVRCVVKTFFMYGIAFSMYRRCNDDNEDTLL